MQTRSHTDRGSKGFIVWRRLNRQVTLAVYFFLPLLSFSSRTCPNAWRGGQATLEAWKALIVDVLFLTILFNILFFRLVQIRRDVLAGSLLPLASILSCTVITMAGNCLSGICDRFPVEHVHTPGGQVLLEALSWVLEKGLPLSDRFPVEQIHTPGGQIASC